MHLRSPGLPNPSQTRAPGRSGQSRSEMRPPCRAAPFQSGNAFLRSSTSLERGAPADPAPRRVLRASQGSGRLAPAPASSQCPASEREWVGPLPCHVSDLISSQAGGVEVRASPTPVLSETAGIGLPRPGDPAYCHALLGGPSSVEPSFVIPLWRPVSHFPVDRALS